MSSKHNLNTEGKSGVVNLHLISILATMTVVVFLILFPLHTPILLGLLAICLSVMFLPYFQGPKDEPAYRRYSVLRSFIYIAALATATWKMIGYYS